MLSLTPNWLINDTIAPTASMRLHLQKKNSETLFKNFIQSLQAINPCPGLN